MERGGYEAENLIGLIDIDNLPADVDLEVQSMLTVMLSKITIDQLPSRISETVHYDIPLPVHILFKAALNEHGKNLRGLWKRLVLFALESGAQEFHGGTHLKNSMTEWLQVDNKEYHHNRDIVAKESALLYKLAFTEDERRSARAKMPITGSLMSWAPGFSASRGAHSVTPLLTMAILGNDNILDPYPTPVFPNPLDSEEFFTRPDSEKDHQHARDVTLRTVKGIQRDGGIWIFDNNKLLMDWMCTSMMQLLKNMGWTLILSSGPYGLEVFKFADECNPSKDCRILVHPPLGITSDSRKCITQFQMQERSNLAELLRQVYTQLRSGKQEHDDRSGNILFAAHVRQAASCRYHLDPYVSTLIFKDQLASVNLFAPEHHDIGHDASSSLIAKNARIASIRRRQNATGRITSSSLLQNVVNFLSFVPSEELQEAADSVHDMLRVNKAGNTVSSTTFIARQKSLLDQGRFFRRGEIQSTLDRCFVGQKQNKGGRYVVHRAIDLESMKSTDALIEFLIRSGEDFWIKDDHKKSADENDPPVGSVVPDIWNKRPSKPFVHNEVELCFLQHPQRVVRCIVWESLRKRFKASTALNPRAKHFPDYDLLSLPAVKNRTKPIVKVNGWRCCCIQLRI
jgi:hypothetical protein